MESNYVDCVSNILIKNLKILDVTERPIHCSDKKRLQFYIKDGETWEKDINKLDQSIDNIHNKQYNLYNDHGVTIRMKSIFILNSFFICMHYKVFFCKCCS